jgi:hypothetical protein
VTARAILRDQPPDHDHGTPGGPHADHRRVAPTAHQAAQFEVAGILWARGELWILSRRLMEVQFLDGERWSASLTTISARRRGQICC